MYHKTMLSDKSMFWMWKNSLASSMIIRRADVKESGRVSL